MLTALRLGLCPGEGSTLYSCTPCAPVRPRDSSRAHPITATSTRLVLGYKRSLLYLISNALEEQAHVPVLGMAKFFDATVVRQNLPHLQYRVAPSSPATGATQHGNIDDDGKSQASVLAHIQGKPIPAP